MPDFSPNKLGLHFTATGVGEGSYKFSIKKKFFFCYENKVRPKRHIIEEGEVMKAHTASTEIQQSPYPFLFKRSPRPCPGS